MERQLKALNLPFERIAAVDGRNLAEEDLLRLAVKSRRDEWPDLLTPNMIACSLSHYHVYKKMVEDDIPYALVLEDDVFIGKELSLLLKHIPAILKPEDIYLVYFHGDEKKFSSEGKQTITGPYAAYKAVKVWGAYSTGGYILRKEAAAKLHDFVFPVHTTPDSWGVFYREGIIKGLWAILPLVTRSANFGSDIGYHKLNKLIRKIEQLRWTGVHSLMRIARRKLGKGGSPYKIVDEAPEWQEVA
jgi:glycosyl transferase family 25